MKRSKRAAVLSTCFSALVLSACGEQRVVEHLPTPPDRLVCEKAGDRPTVPAEYRIDWSQIRTVAEARAEHEKFVAVLRTREGIVAGYVLRLEQQLFVCWNNVEWRRRYEAELAR